jgi:hypothetical protein
MMDDGYPFMTELNVLQDMIQGRGIIKDVFEKVLR